MDGRCRAISYGGLGAQGLELGRADAGDVGQVVDGGEGAVAVAVLHDARGQGRADAGQGLQFGGNGMPQI